MQRNQRVVQGPDDRWGRAGRTVCPDPPRDGPPSEWFLAVLQRTGQAAALLDGDGRVVAMNRRAEAYIGGAIRIFDGRLTSGSRAVDDRLRGLVRGILCPTATDGGAIVVVPRADGFPVIVGGTPIGAAAWPLFPRAKALVTFTSACRDALPEARLIREVFGLTATEADVALALAGGARAGAIACDRGVTIETVRTHLKRAFLKTGTTRQATLVALILGLRGLPPSEP